MLVTVLKRSRRTVISCAVNLKLSIHFSFLGVLHNSFDIYASSFITYFFATILNMATTNLPQITMDIFSQLEGEIIDRFMEFGEAGDEARSGVEIVWVRPVKFTGPDLSPGHESRMLSAYELNEEGTALTSHRTLALYKLELFGDRSKSGAHKKAPPVTAPISTSVSPAKPVEAASALLASAQLDAVNQRAFIDQFESQLPRYKAAVTQYGSPTFPAAQSMLSIDRDL